jgi:hypothetical protein
MYICIYVCVCIYVSISKKNDIQNIIYIYYTMCTSMICIWMSMYMCLKMIYLYVYIFILIHVHMRIYIYISCVCIYIYTYVLACDILDIPKTGSHSSLLPHLLLPRGDFDAGIRNTKVLGQTAIAWVKRGVTGHAGPKKFLWLIMGNKGYTG